MVKCSLSPSAGGMAAWLASISASGCFLCGLIGFGQWSVMCGFVQAREGLPIQLCALAIYSMLTTFEASAS